MPAMKSRHYLIDQRFNKLTIKSHLYRNKREYLVCMCDCGKEVIKRLDGVLSGHCKSCNCLNKEQINRDLTTHNLSYSLEYGSWKGMKQRCYNTKGKKYHIYGGKGIRVCDRWLNSFSNFIQDMGKRPTNDYSLDRINPEGNYEPSNCRWITKSENSSRGTVNRNLIHGNPFKRGRP